MQCTGRAPAQGCVPWPECSSPPGLHPGPGVLCSVPQVCSGVRFPWQTLTRIWEFSFSQAPHPTGASFLPKPPSSLGEISHQIQSHWAPQADCTGSASQENGTRKKIPHFHSLGRESKAQDCYKLSLIFSLFFPDFLLQQMEFRTGSLNQIACSHRKPLHVAHLIINISAPQFNKITGTFLYLFNLRQLLIFSCLRGAFPKTEAMLVCLTKHWFNKRCCISFSKFHHAKGK